MRLTPPLLAAAYDLLRHTPPFEKWNLPEPDDVLFGVLRSTQFQADCRQMPAGTFRIRVSEPYHGRLSVVLATVGHEMIHLHLDQCGAKDSSEHGAAFRACAAEVVAHHRDFDIETFL